MQKLFENWRLYLNETLLLESRIDDAKRAVVKGFEEYPDIVRAFEKFIENIGNENTGGNKHLLGLAKLINKEAYADWSAMQLQPGGAPSDGEEAGGEGKVLVFVNNWINAFRRTIEAHRQYSEYADRKIQISNLNIVQQLGGSPISDLVSKDLGLPKRGYREQAQDRPKRPIVPITIYSNLQSWFNVVAVAKRIIRERDYPKDPEVIKKAKETTKIIADNQYYRIFHPGSKEAACILGCSTWCISKVPDEGGQGVSDTSNLFDRLIAEGKRFYIVDFKYLRKTANRYKKITLEYEKNSGGEPVEVWDCGENRPDFEQRGVASVQPRDESGVEMGIKYNLLALARTGTEADDRVSLERQLGHFENFLDGKPVEYLPSVGRGGPGTEGWVDPETNMAKNLGIDLESEQNPRDQWELMVDDIRSNIESLSSGHLVKLDAPGPVEQAMTMLFDGETYPFVGLWRTIGQEGLGYTTDGEPLASPGRPGGTAKWNEIKKVLENNPEVFEQVQERLQQEAGGPNVGAARNLVWDAVRRLTPSLEWMWEDIYLKHWDPRGLREDPEEWFEQHVGDLAEEIINVMININPAALMGYLGVDTDVSKWLADGNNRDWLAAELRRMLEENIDTAIELAKALASENPQMAVEKTWELFYKSLGKEIGHLIDRAFGSDEDRALELARERDRENLQENRKRNRRLLISIG